MKATIEIDDGLLGRARAEAERRGVDVAVLVEEALAEALAATAGPATKGAPLPTFRPPAGMEGLQPGVNLSDIIHGFP